MRAASMDGPCFAKILVPTRIAGALIGKLGIWIDQIQRMSGCRMQVSLPAALFPGTQDRMVVISGEKGCLESGIDMVLNRVREKQSNGATMSTKLVIPSSAVSRLLGHQGTTVKHIIGATGCRIKVSLRVDGLRERLVVVSGSFDALVQTTLAVVRCVQQDVHLREHMSLTYEIMLPLGTWFGHRSLTYDPDEPLLRPQDAITYSKRELITHLHKTAPREVLLKYALLGGINKILKTKGRGELAEAVAATWLARHLEAPPSQSMDPDIWDDDVGSTGAASAVELSTGQRAVKMYVEVGQYEKAHKVAKSHMSPHERTELYISLAQGLEQQGKLNEAEQLYLMVNEFDLAINMYKKREEYEQMLRLVSKYRKELLNDTCKHIAEQYEMKCNLKKAEHYYVEAKMWTSAMSMYRQLEKWEDAKRVAKVHGGKSSFEKVVLAQAHATLKESGAEAGAQLLAKHGLIEIAIDYAVEHSNFQHAFELASHSAKHKLPDIHLKKALALEDDEQFKLAEEEFIKASKPKEAIDMYIHQRDWVSAMRVAETHDRDGVREVMVHQAKDLVDQNSLQAAESLFIQAGKPELAVQAYSSKRLVNDAVRICKKYCPQMLGDVVDSQLENGGNGGPPQTLEEILDAAKIYEETGNYSRAIDTYLSVNETSSSDADRLEEVWENAVRLAMKHAQERYNDIVAIVAKRLKMIQRFEAAAELYESIEAAREAVNCYIAGEVWEKAKLLAQQQCPDMIRVVEERYKSDLVNKGDGDEPAGPWARCTRQCVVARICGANFLF